jgi:hypothetical protein
MSATTDRRLTNVPLRVGVWFLALVTLAVGVTATLAPRVFYDHVPWVALALPYSEPLMRDYGAMNLALALVSLVAAMTMDRLTVRTALAAWLMFAIPHLVFHVTHHRHYTQGQTIGETAALAISVLLPVALLALTPPSKQAASYAEAASAFSSSSANVSSSWSGEQSTSISATGRPRALLIVPSLRVPLSVP